MSEREKFEAHNERIKFEQLAALCELGDACTDIGVRKALGEVCRWIAATEARRVTPIGPLAPWLLTEISDGA